jgi:hypothetical protein
MGNVLMMVSGAIIFGIGLFLNTEEKQLTNEDKSVNNKDGTSFAKNEQTSHSNIDRNPIDNAGDINRGRNKEKPEQNDSSE